MKIAVLSDIHSNTQALKAVLGDCQKQHIDEYWLLGDHVDYCAGTVETVKILSDLKAKYIISGNHDACLFDENVRSSDTPHGIKSFEYTKKIVSKHKVVSDWLKTFAHIPMLHISDKKTLLVHGTPFDPYWGKFTPGDDIGAMFSEMERLDVQIMLTGHSHKSYLLTQNGRKIINPGSVGQPRNGDSGAQYVILEDDSVTFKSVPYDIESTAAEIKNADLPEYLWQRLYIGM